MLNTPITPPRVPIIDPRTGLIDRAWYLFFLSLFQSTTTNANIPDVGPDNAGVTEQVSELNKALQSILVGPENAGVLEQLSELAKQSKAFQVGPTSSALLEQIAALRNEVQAFYLLPSNQASATSGVTSVDGSGGATGLTLTGGPITSSGTLTLGGTLAVASGGTGTATPALVAGTNVSITGAWPNQTINSSGGGSGMIYPGAGIANSTGSAWGTSYSTTGSGTVVLSTSPTLVTPILGTPTSGTLTNATGLPLTTGVTGILPILNGGTGTTTPALVAGTNITITGAWPNQTVNATGSGVTSFSAGTTGLTPATATTGVVTLAGILAVGNGGTGATTLDGADIVTKSGTQTITGAKTFTSPTNQFTGTNFYTTDGTSSNGYLFENIGYAAFGGTYGVVFGSGAYPGTGRVVVDNFGGLNTLRPYADNVTTLGTSVYRWANTYFTNSNLGTVQTGTWNGSPIGIAYGGTGLTTTPANGELDIGNGSGFTRTTLTAGSGVTITNSSGGISISATGAGGTITAVTGTAPVVSSGGTAPDISMAAATTSVSGYLTSTDWNTFNGKGTVTSVAALTLGTSGTDVSSTVATGTTTPVITFNLPSASATNRGALTAADWTTFNNKGSGTVTAVTGTAPVVSSGGATPAISMPAATTSVSGYLTSTDWTTFNNKGSGTVTSVSATVPSFLSVSGSPITTSGTLALTYSGTALPAANGGTGATTLTGAGIVTLTDTQTITGAKTLNNLTNQFTGTVYSTSDGTTSNGYLFENIGYAALGGTNGVVLGSGTYSGTGRIVVDVLGGLNTLRPYADNVTSLGTSVYRYTVVYATTGTINTSDATEKQQVRELNDAERRTAQRIKSLIRAFKWNEAVESKGDGARIHIGVMAQDVEAAFTAEGLDASKYGLFCRDTWDTLDGPPQTRLGVRYEELLAFVIGSL